MNNLAAMGGPVGAQQMQNVGTPGSMAVGSAMDNKRKLNTYIYDYFLKNDMFDLARALCNEVEIETTEKPSPTRKDINGASDGMDTDSKGDIPKKPADLPRPNVPSEVDSSFLLDWWSQFWDCWSASRVKTASAAKQYLQHVQVRGQMANDRQRQMMANPAQAMNARNGMLPNGMQMSNEVKKAMMMQGGRPPTQAQLQQLRMQQQQQHMVQQTQMQREGSQMDMNGQPRPQTPGSGEAPSPKRQRLEGGGFNGQMGPMGRGQNPVMPGAQFNGMPMQTPNAQAKPMQGMPNPAGLPQGSPADQSGEMFNNNNLRTMAQPGANNSNHALQDYQMQLMLLEQQNKKRLLMARQEQDSQTGPGGPMPGQPGFVAPAMSPSGSRTGPSPNPDEQMKRGTPKMAPGGMPQPGLDMQGRASPIPGFDPNQMNPNMPPNFQAMKMQAGMMGPNGQMMAAATSHPAFSAQMNGQMTPQQMEMMRQQAMNAARPNGPWPQGPPPGMMHGGQPQQPPNMTPQQRNAMPPPPAPATGDNQNRTQPSSPQQNAAPPTPSQTNKPAPKKKESGKSKKAANKKNAAATAATPASEAGDQPPTPTPAPPITPTAPPQQFNKTGPAQAATVPPPAAQAVANPAPQPDMSAGPFGGSLDGTDMNFGMDFGGLDGQDVLDNFDFDSFLNADNNDGAFAFDATMGFGADGGLEAGGDV